MKMKKGRLKLMGKGHSDELYTPNSVVDILLPFIPKGSVIFECAVGSGKLRDKLKEEGFDVVCSDDFFSDFPEYDVIITNPPFSIKDKFLEEAYKRKKPFAMLLPITALEGLKRQKLYSDNGIQIIFPLRRTDFNGKGSPWFYTAWFCWKLNLPKDLNFLPPNQLRDKR